MIAGQQRPNHNKENAGSCWIDTRHWFIIVGVSKMRNINRVTMETVQRYELSWEMNPLPNVHLRNIRSKKKMSFLLHFYKPLKHVFITLLVLVEMIILLTKTKTKYCNRMPFVCFLNWWLLFSQNITQCKKLYFISPNRTNIVRIGIWTQALHQRPRFFDLYIGKLLNLSLRPLTHPCMF